MTKKKLAIGNPSRKTQQHEEQYGVREGFWLYLLLGLMALFSAYMLHLHFNGFVYLLNIQSAMVGVALFLSPLFALAFCILFIYKHARGYRITLIPKLVAYILAFSLVLILLIVIPAGSQCTPTATSDCSLVFPFILAALSYSHTLEAAILAIFLLAGTIALLLEEKRST